jgi:hypothetical protein
MRTRTYREIIVVGEGGIMFHTAFDCENDVAGYGTIRNSCGDSATMFLGVILSSRSNVGRMVRSIAGVAAMVGNFKNWTLLKWTSLL